MPHTPHVAIALLAVLLVPAVVAAPAVAFEARGSYLASTGVSAIALDACGNRLQQGLDSSCVALPDGLDGRTYEVSYTGILVALPVVCFYTAEGRFLDCDRATGVVPAGAGEVAIASWSGTRVDWTLRVFTQ